MHKIKKIFIGILIVIAIFIALTFSLRSIQSLTRRNLCKDDIISMSISPDQKKKVVIFVTNCGATTGWVAKASIINNSDTLLNGAVANTLSIGSNNGKAAPLDKEGWPIILANWQDTNHVEIMFSNNSEEYLKKDLVDNVQVRFSYLTQ